MYCCSFPSPSQSRFVERYFYSRPEAGSVHGRSELIIPDGTTGLMFVTQGCIQRRRIGQSMPEYIKGSHLFGQKTHSVWYDNPSNNLEVFGAKFKPGALKMLFNIKSNDLTDTSVDFDLVANKHYRHLEESIQEAQHLSGKINIIESFFRSIENQHEADEKAKLFLLILDDIHKTEGDDKISEISVKYNVTYKQLERLFKMHVGMTPKLYSRMIRFNRSFKSFAKSNRKRLTDIAYDSGYFDQMHFIKEVKKFTGQSPSQLFFKEHGPMERAQMKYVCG